MWGLAAYGADGVQSVVELLQNDLARHMAAIGVSNLKGLNRTFVKMHRR
jgi:isopentenyl diphosphate isomerase/L-lactate dehydrogenase-like FMN-dependent dehydrogenase